MKPHTLRTACAFKLTFAVRFTYFQPATSLDLVCVCLDIAPYTIHTYLTDHFSYNCCWESQLGVDKPVGYFKRAAERLNPRQPGTDSSSGQNRSWTRVPRISRWSVVVPTQWSGSPDHRQGGFFLLEEEMFVNRKGGLRDRAYNSLSFYEKTWKSNNLLTKLRRRITLS